MSQKLVIFGTSNILSDLFDCALANGIGIAKIVPHLGEQSGPRDVSLADRIAALAPLGQYPIVETLAEFQPQADELYLLGPTTPTRAVLAQELTRRFGLGFTRLIHPSAHISPLARLGAGVFIGANSVIAPGAVLAEHVFVNRSVTIGHDTAIGAFSRIQPGGNLGGLSRFGHSVTVGIGATTVERLAIGDRAFIGAGSVVTKDVAADSMVFGVPAKFVKSLVVRG